MSDSDILKEAREAFAECESVETDNRKLALDDLKFARLGEQWPAKVAKQREVDGRPCLTINKMPSFIRQVVNDSRQNKPAISVHPVEKGDEKTAEVMGGLIRNIETISNADIAYDTGVDNSVTMGFGYWRINVDYACDDSFDKDILIGAVPNAFSIYGDPYNQGADSSGWMTAFVIDEMAEAQFKRKYPKAKINDFASGGWSQATGWCDTAKKKARVAEYWKRSEIMRNLIQFQAEGLTEIQVGYEDELAKIQKDYGSITPIDGAVRPVKSYKVMQYTLSGLEVLGTVDWVGKYIPIVPVYGEEVNVEGKRHLRSLIRDAKDPQRMFNYWRTSSTELVALAPKAPYLGKKGTFKSDAAKWATANNASHAYIEFDNEMPQRQPFNGVPAGDLQEALNASDDMKSVMGIFDASLGARSNETSGRAIMARQREGDVSTFHFLDNLQRSIRHTGKILIDLIPKVYNTERMIRVMGQDGKSSSVKITDKDGEHRPDEKIYNLTLGKYDLVVKAGASYTTQREEALNMLTEIVRATPDAAVILGDIILELMDIPGGEKAIKRMQAMLPPQVKQAEEGDNPEAAAAQAQVKQITDQAQQAMGQAMEQINLLRDELDQAKADKSIDERKANNDSYKAVTDRIKAIGDMMTPEMVAMLAGQTLQDADETAQLVPGGDVSPGIPMLDPGMETMPQQMEPMSQDVGQPEPAQL